MNKVLLVCLLAVPAIVTAQDEAMPKPKQSLKVDIKVIQDGKPPIALHAKKPELAARQNMITADLFWRFSFPVDQPLVPTDALAFASSVDPNEISGGGFYLCSMKEDDDKCYFNVSANGTPKSGYVETKPSGFETTTGKNGGFSFKLKKALKPGRYVFYTSDNQYAWPFIIK